MTAPASFPDKLFYRIQEAADIVGVQPYVLRYWETRFTMLRPERMGKDERRYRKSDIHLLLRIRRLLYDEQFTIPGAVDRLKRDPTGALDAEFEGRLPKLPQPREAEQLDLLAQEYRVQASGVAQALDRLRELRRELIRLLEESPEPPRSSN